MTTTVTPTTKARQARAERVASRLAEIHALMHPLDHMVPDGCYDCHSFAGPIVGCACAGCTAMRGQHPERALKAGRLVAVDGSRTAAIPTSAEVAAHATDMAAQARPAGTGTGSGHGDPATAAQLAYIERLSAERAVEAIVPASRKAASREIDRLLALPRAAAPAAAPLGQFVTIDGDWMVRIPGPRAAGDDVEVRKGGGTKTVTLATRYGRYETGVEVWRIVDDRAQAAPVECPEGIHQAADGTIYKVYRTQTSGRLAAKRLREVILPDGRRKGSFSYCSSAIQTEGLSDATLLDHEAAAEFGALYGFCCACGLFLDDDRSVAAGYGPKCAKRYGWPWGKKLQVAAPPTLTEEPQP